MRVKCSRKSEYMDACILSQSFWLPNPAFPPVILMISRKLTGEIGVELPTSFVTFLLSESFPSLPILGYWKEVQISVLLRNPMVDSDVLPGVRSPEFSARIFGNTKSLLLIIVS